MRGGARRADAPTAAEHAAQAAARFVARPDIFDVEILWATDAALHLAATVYTLVADRPVDIPSAVTAGETEAARKRFLEPLASRGVVLALSPSRPPAEGSCSLVWAVLGEAERYAKQRYEAASHPAIRDILDRLVRADDDSPSPDDRRLGEAIVRSAQAVLRSASTSHPDAMSVDELLLRRPRRPEPTWLERCRSIRTTVELVAAGSGRRGADDPKVRHLARGADRRATVESIIVAREALGRVVRRSARSPTGRE